jgi:hypothetical protein
VNRDAKTQSALIALARSRRVQRALAHAYLHRDDPMPTLRSSLGYLTGTATVTLEASACNASEIEHELTAGHRMSVIGMSSVEDAVYVVEDLGGHEAPIVYRLCVCGPRAGFLVPLHAWYEHARDPDEIRDRLRVLATRLELMVPTTTEAWMLSTRVIQRRALKISGRSGEPPIRKFALALAVEPVSGHGPSGRSTVTAFLRPHAKLAEVWLLPGGDHAVARVTFTGVPSGVGQAKDTMILLTADDRWDDGDALDSQG